VRSTHTTSIRKTSVLYGKKHTFAQSVTLTAKKQVREAVSPFEICS